MEDKFRDVGNYLLLCSEMLLHYENLSSWMFTKGWGMLLMYRNMTIALNLWYHVLSESSQDSTISICCASIYEKLL